MGCAWSERGPRSELLFVPRKASAVPSPPACECYHHGILRWSKLSRAAFPVMFTCSCWYLGCGWFLLAIFFLPWAVGHTLTLTVLGPCCPHEPPFLACQGGAEAPGCNAGCHRWQQAKAKGVSESLAQIVCCAVLCLLRMTGTIREHTSSVPVLMVFCISPGIKSSIKVVQIFAPSFTNSLWPYIFGDKNSLC